MVEDLYKICENLKKQGKIIVCSLANGSKVSYPATFDNVIGVRGFILEDENSFWYNKDKNIQCIMDNNPYMNCTVNNSYKLFGKCNSQSTAKLTGRIANLLSEEPDITFDLLNKKLEDLSNKRGWTENDLLASKRYPDYKNVIYAKNNSILLNTAAIVKDVLKLDKNNNDVYEFSLFDAQIGLNNDNCFEVLKKLEEKFNIKFDYLNISRYDFVSIQTLSDLVVKTLKDSNSVNNNLAVVSELL
jgi:acyl carrier protein